MFLLPAATVNASCACKRGFTLIELSIVLVIIGLVVGGLLVGRDLIQQSEIRRIANDLRAIEQAVSVFKLKYGAEPGDMGNASSIWSGAVNGNGNGTLTGSTGGLLEEDNFLPHLFLAGLVATNPPAPKISNGRYLVNAGGGPANFSQPNEFIARADGTIGSVAPTGAIALWVVGQWGFKAFTPQEARSLDMKIDDGIGHTGKIGALDGCYNDTHSGLDWGLCSGDFGHPFVYGPGTGKLCNIVYWIGKPYGGMADWPAAC